MADTTRNARSQVYDYLMHTRGLVKMSTSAVLGGIVHHDYVVIHDAPAMVIREIVDRFVMVSLTENGLLIPLTDD